MLHKKRKKKSDFSREADHIKQVIKKTSSHYYVDAVGKSICSA